MTPFHKIALKPMSLTPDNKEETCQDSRRDHAVFSNRPHSTHTFRLKTMRIIKKAFNAVGLDIVRLSKSPKYSLLGTNNLPIRTIIDVGANTGQFAKMISKIFTEAKIYSFEPLPEPFEELMQWAVQQRGRVKAFNLALGETERETKMFSHVDHSSSSSFLRTTDTCKELYPFIQKQAFASVKQTTLDNWVKSLTKSLISETLIKLDVQGYEDRVIRGGQETFEMAKACILEVNLDSLYEDQATFKNIFMLLYDLGYRYVGNQNQTYADDGHVIFIDAVFVK